MRTGFSDGLLVIQNTLYYGDIVNSRIGALLNFDSYQTANSISLSDSVTSSSSPETLNWIDTFSLDLNNKNKFYFTTNKLNLFFTNAMDFTGQSGSNFRIYSAVISSSSSSSSSKNGGIGGNTLAIIIGFGIVFVVIAIFYYFRRQRDIVRKELEIFNKLEA